MVLDCPGKRTLKGAGKSQKTTCSVRTVCHKVCSCSSAYTRNTSGLVQHWRMREDSVDNSLYSTQNKNWWIREASNAFNGQERSFDTSKMQEIVYIGVISMRQEQVTTASSCNCILVPSVKSSLNGTKMLHFRSNNKKGRGHPLPAPTPLGPSTNAPSALDLSTLPLLKLKFGNALAYLAVSAQKGHGTSSPSQRTSLTACVFVVHKISLPTCEDLRNVSCFCHPFGTFDCDSRRGICNNRIRKL